MCSTTDVCAIAYSCSKQELASRGHDENVDDTTDIVQKSQCSLIIKYVNASGKLVERFLGFYDTSSNRTAETLFNLASTCLEKLDYKSKLIGECFDAFRRKLKKVVPQAVFVHCLAHRLNLVL
ncbi:hypothetical protein ILUMI_13628, partial [Ignelater luminosus]